MNLAQMLATGPKLEQPKDAHPNKFDEHFVQDVLLQCLPGNTHELKEKSGYSSRIIVRYMKQMIEQGLVQTRRRKTVGSGGTRIYEKTRKGDVC